MAGGRGRGAAGPERLRERLVGRQAARGHAFSGEFGRAGSFGPRPARPAALRPQGGRGGAPRNLRLLVRPGGSRLLFLDPAGGDDPGRSGRRAEGGPDRGGTHRSRAVLRTGGPFPDPGLRGRDGGPLRRGERGRGVAGSGERRQRRDRGLRLRLGPCGLAARASAAGFPPPPRPALARPW